MEMSGGRKPSWKRQWHPTPVLLPGESHGPCQESDMTEWLHFHFSLSCIGEGNGNPLQCSCLENPRDGGAWWAAVYGVAQSQTRLKRLSSSSRKPSKKPNINSVAEKYNKINEKFTRGVQRHLSRLKKDSASMKLGQLKWPSLKKAKKKD